MYEIDLNLPKQIVADVLSNHEIHSVAFVGCGASMSDLYPAVPTKTARKIGRKYMMAYRPEPAQMCIR